MNGDDIHAFGPRPGGMAPASPPPARRRRVWPWLLGAVLLLVGLAAAGSVALVGALLDGAAEGVQVFVDGQPWPHEGPGTVAAALAVTAVLLCAGTALLIGMLVMAVAVPLALLLALLGVVVCVVFGLAGPLLAVAVLTAVLAAALTAVLAAVLTAVLAAALLSPLWLALLLLWWLLRRRPSTAQASAATMRA